MKIICNLIFFVSISLSAVSQRIDTVYVFCPKILGKQQLAKLDSFSNNQQKVLLYKDSANSSLLNVSIININNKLIEKGDYLTDSSNLIYRRVYDTLGNMRQKVKKVEIIYLRQGYWQIFGKRQNKALYFDRGKVLKMSIPK